MSNPGEASAPGSGRSEGIKIINAALFRMATKSMAQAYIILGYKTHHGLLEDATKSPWQGIEKAAEATWPTVPGATPRPPNTRADWDELWGSRFEAVTDLASPFATELIRAYPEAKVVVVQRDFESWWPSFTSQLRDGILGEPLASVIGFLGWNLMGFRGLHAMKKVLRGFFGVTTKAELDKECARRAYDKYFRDIRALVPAERRLEYKMGDGWEPLCEFLGVPVPDVEFPSANNRKSHEQEVVARYRQLAVGISKVLGPFIVAGGAVAWWYTSRA